MKSGSSIEILRAGSFVDRNGRKVELSETDIDAIASGYDPALHEAPLVVGHPKHDDPAYGWVERLKADKGSLEATPCRVSRELSEAVGAGRYRKVSASLYPPQSPRNPTPNAWYLRHVGFLGAQPPVVKGLRPAELAEDDDAVEIEFGERETWAFRSIGSLFRKFREWVIQEKDIETADEMLPSWLIEDVERAAESDAQFSEPEPAPKPGTGEDMGGKATETVDLAEREQKLAEREQKLADQEKQAAEREAAAQRKGAVEFAEAQVKAGRILPAEKDGLVETLAVLDAAQPVEFAEGDESPAKHELGKWLRKTIEGLDKRVEFSEVAGGPLPESGARPGAADPNADPQRDALHRRAVELSEREGIEYVAAVKRLGG